MAVPITADPVENRIGGTEQSFHGFLWVCHSGFHLLIRPHPTALVQIPFDNKALNGNPQGNRIWVDDFGRERSVTFKSEEEMPKTKFQMRLPWTDKYIVDMVQAMVFVLGFPSKIRRTT